MFGILVLVFQDGNPQGLLSYKSAGALGATQPILLFSGLRVLMAGSERDDPAEASSIHFTAKVDDRVIGAGCWVVGSRKDEATGKRYTFVRYRQMVIDPKFEARGIGTRMMRHVEQEARKIGAAEIVANVRVENVEYFKRHDWIEIGEGVTLYDQVDSLSMVKPLRYAIDGGPN